MKKRDVPERFYAIVIILIFIVLQMHSVSAQNEFIIHLDEGGTATFAGTIQNNNTKLPQGISIINNSLEGLTTVLTKKNGEIWTFAFFFQNSTIQVYLPNNSIVEQIKGNLLTENNKIVIKSNNSISVSYKLQPSSKNTITPTKSSERLGIIFLLALLIAGILLFYIRKRIKKWILNKIKPKKRKNGQNNSKNKIELLNQILNEKENKILSILRNKGKMKCSYLQKTSEIPKSSFFRNLQELEKKKLVIRSGPGRNKFVDIIK